MSFHAWLAFMAVWVAVSIPLGPNALNCMASAAAHGFRRGLWSVAGVFAAACLYLTLAASGVAAFLAAYPAFFEVTRWAGVAYLAWMGVALLRSRGEMDGAAPTAGFNAMAAMRRAALISLGNPKAIFVWLAVFTQFIDPGAPLAPQLAVLAPSALGVALAVYVAYCALGLGAGRVFAGRRKLWFDRGAGGAYLIFAAGLATADLRRN